MRATEEDGLKTIDIRSDTPIVWRFFASTEAANELFKTNDPEGVAFEYPVEGQWRAWAVREMANRPSN